MLLYLVRHGRAERSDGDDRLRQLTKGGRAEVGRLADALVRAEVRVQLVHHSGFVRARQTAEILHEAVDGEIGAAPGLAPMDNVASAARRLDDTPCDSMMLVGHLPFMGRMAAYLLSGDADADFVHFRTASIACVSGIGRAWQLEWFLEPHIL